MSTSTTFQSPVAQGKTCALNYPLFHGMKILFERRNDTGRSIKLSEAMNYLKKYLTLVQVTSSVQNRLMDFNGTE